MTEVWGPPSLRLRMKQLGKTGATGGGMGGVLEACGDCGMLSPVEGAGLAAVLGAILIVGLAFLVGYWLISMVVTSWRRWRVALKPRGAAVMPLRDELLPRYIGVVDARISSEPSPLGRKDCLGYGVLLTCKQSWRSEAVTLREASTNGFEVKLMDGGKIRIPPGPIIVEMSGARTIEPIAVDIERYLATLDPSRPAGDDLGPFPYNHIKELRIRRGDRVEIQGALRPVLDTRATPNSYREPAASLLVPEDIPRIRVLRSACGP